MFNMEDHTLDDIEAGVTNLHFEQDDKDDIATALADSASAVQAGKRTHTHTGGDPFVFTGEKQIIVVEVEDTLTLVPDASLPEGHYTIELRQDATGHNINLASGDWQFKAAYTFSNTANKIDVLQCYYNGDKAVVLEVLTDIQTVA